MDVNSLYIKLPIILQNFAISLKGFYIEKTRFGKNFKKYLNYFQNSDVDTVNKTQLNKFLNHANSSRFWNDRFDKFKVDLNGENLIEEISKLPVLTKEEVIFNRDNIKVTNLKQKVLQISTSGTTGASLNFYQTQETENKQWAIWWRHRQRHGLKLNDWMGWFGGKLIVPKDQNKPPYHRVNFFSKQIMFSPIHLNQDTAIYYYEEIRKRNLKWLHGYPSQISLLASYILENKLPKINSVKKITTGAEGLMEYQKQMINKAFGVNPIEHYGLTEGVANISQMPDASYCADQDFAFVEFIPLPKDKSLCKIVGTNYNNPAFPLIRYDTGDLAKIDWESDPPKILGIEGRSDDYITLGNGNRFGPMNQIFKKFKNVKEAQVYYPETNYIEIRIVKSINFRPNEDEKIILESINERLSDNVKLSVKYLYKIPRSKSGKIKSVVTK